MTASGCTCAGGSRQRANSACQDFGPPKRMDESARCCKVRARRVSHSQRDAPTTCQTSTEKLFSCFGKFEETGLQGEGEERNICKDGRASQTVLQPCPDHHKVDVRSEEVRCYAFARELASTEREREIGDRPTSFSSRFGLVLRSNLRQCRCQEFRGASTISHLRHPLTSERDSNDKRT